MFDLNDNYFCAICGIKLLIYFYLYKICILTSITPNFNWGDGLVIGGIIFVCGVVPVSYVYRLRIKQEKDMEEEV